MYAPLSTTSVYKTVAHPPSYPLSSNSHLSISKLLSHKTAQLSTLFADLFYFIQGVDNGSLLL